jgi:hypothetical protein
LISRAERSSSSTARDYAGRVVAIAGTGSASGRTRDSSAAARIGKGFCAISTNPELSAAMVSEAPVWRCSGDGCGRKIFSLLAQSRLKFRAAQAQLRRLCATRTRCVPRDRHR